MILTALTLDDVTKEVRQHRWRREEVPGRSPGHASVEGEGKEDALTKETGSSRQWGRRESRGHGILESTGRTGFQEEGAVCSGHASLRETSRWPGPLHLLPPGSNTLWRPSPSLNLILACLPHQLLPFQVLAFSQAEGLTDS